LPTRTRSMCLGRRVGSSFIVHESPGVFARQTSPLTTIRFLAVGAPLYSTRAQSPWSFARSSPAPRSRLGNGAGAKARHAEAARQRAIARIETSFGARGVGGRIFNPSPRVA